jgi:site-specific DNA-cytosine methylase
MKVAILFEYSGVVRDAFLRHGHDAVSCDLLPTEYPGPHIRGDATKRAWEGYDLIIAHPPCTHIAVSGNRHYANTPERQAAADLIDWVWNLSCDRLCIENPVGQINKYLPHLPRPQYIQPHWFGHPESKKTGLWKRNLPDLVPTNILPTPQSGYWANQTPSGQNKLGPSPDRAKIRSRTYEGIAEAIASQWS